MSDQKQPVGQTQPTRPVQPAQAQQQQPIPAPQQQQQTQQPNGNPNNNNNNPMQMPVASLQQAPTPVPPGMQQPTMSVSQMIPQAVMTPGPVPTPGVMPIAAATPQPMQVPQPGTPLQMAQGAAIRGSMPQQVSLSQMPGVQVIQQPIHSPPYIQPFFNQQFQMYQNAAVQGIHQAMQVSNMNPQMGLAVQGRPPSVGPKSPTMIAPVPPTSQVQMKPPGGNTSSPSPANGSNKSGMNGKPGTAPPNPQQQQQQQQQQAQRMQGTIMQRPQSQPVVIGQVGMIPNQICSSQQMMVAQPKSPIVSIAPSSQPQMINGGQPLRFTTQPTFVTNNGQIIAGTNSALVGNQVLGHLQAMAATLATQNMPIQQQQILATQTPTLIGNPPLYIRAAPPGQLQPQQGIVGTVQPAQPVQQTPLANIQQAPIQQQPALMPQPQQQQPPQQQQQQQQQTPIQPILKSKAEMVTNSTTTPIRATLNQATRPLNAAPTQKVVGQAQKVLTPANKQAMQQNRTGPKGAVIPINQKPVLAKQNMNANQRTPPNTTQSHPGYERMAHVHPSPATNNAKQIVASLNRPAGTVRVTKPRGRPPKTVSNTPLVNGSMTIPVSQPKVNTGQGNQPPPLLVPIPTKQPVEVKNEERKTSPPTLEPVNTKVEVARKPPATPPAKIDSSTQVVIKKPVKKPEEPSPPKAETPVEKPAEKPPTATPVAGPVEKQKAIVKPQVLTHVIEGFVIQEAQEPFPRSSLLTDFMTPNTDQQARRSRSESKEKEKERREKHAKEMEEKHDEQDEDQDQPMDEDSEPSTEPAECSPEHLPSPKIPEQTSPTIIETHTTPMLKCEYCGKIDKESRFGGSKRFCTTSCAKRYNVGRRTGLFRGRNSKNQQSHLNQRKRPYPATSKRKRSSESRHGPKSPSSYQQAAQTQHVPMEQEDEHSNSMSETTTTSQEESSEPRSPNAGQHDPEMPPEPSRGQAAHGQWFGMRNPPAQWTVQDVCDFIRSMPDCVAYADAFRQQEIDGQALMLLKEDHLMQAMSMKLGPALKICEKIRKIKGEIP